MRLARAVLFAAFAFTFFHLTAQARPANRAVVISDLHFNPLADPALVGQLLAADASRWESILTADATAIQHDNEDSAWPLFASLVSQLQSIQPRPKMILVAGDILPHKFQDKFNSATASPDPASYRSFVQKTVAFVGLELHKAGGGVPVIYTVGNNDTDCGDYALQPNGSFLQDTRQTVQDLAGAAVADLANWNALGSYVTNNPLARHSRVISLNTSFWSRRYSNSCAAKTAPPADPGATVLGWLSDRLQEAQEHGDKVWLIYHVPPGIDGHASARTSQVVPFWKSNYAEGFDKLLDQYRDTIEINLAGHTHLDDIRLVKTEHATSLVLINPGVSPNIGQKPAYRIITADSHGRPLNLLTYYTPDLNSPAWRLEYDARQTWSLKRIDAASYQALYRKIGQPSALADKWQRYYFVSRPASLTDTKAYLRSLYCATGHADTAGYQSCVELADSR